MRAVQDILFGVTSQTVYHDAPEGRPSSVTSVQVRPWNIGDAQTAESAVGSGSVESGPSTTTDASAGYDQSDPRNIPVAATTGATKDRVYLITHATTGLREWFECESIKTNDYLTAKHPLHNAYASGAAVESTRIQATVDSTWVADTSNLLAPADVAGNPMYRVRWVYVVNTVSYVADTYFNLVRYASRHGVLPQDVEAMMPGWLDMLPTDHRIDQGRRLIDDAYRAVRMDMHAIDLSASSIAESEVIDELTRYKAVVLGERSRYLSRGDDVTRVQEAERWYSTRMDSLVRVVSRVPVRDSTGAATPTIAVGISRR